MTNEMSLAGLKLAGTIARIYADNPKVRAVIAGGSVSRGYADKYSDVEIGVFWDSQPSDKERKDAALRIGGEVWKFDPYLRWQGEGASRLVRDPDRVDALSRYPDGVTNPHDSWYCEGLDRCAH